MRRDEPGHALPAWLQDQPRTEAVPPAVRKTSRRVLRPEESGPVLEADPTESLCPTIQIQDTPVASVPFGFPSPLSNRPVVSDEVPPPYSGESNSGGSRSEKHAPVADPEPDVNRVVEQESQHPISEESWASNEADRDPVPIPPLSRDHELPRDHRLVHDQLVHDHQPSTVDLSSDVLVRRSRRSSSAGWRRGVHRLARGLLDTGDAASGTRHDDLVERIRQPISGDYRVAVLSLKGGVGKTTTTIGLGSTFASLRGDCVVAVDANPDFGTLAQRIPQQTDATVRDLLAAAPTIRRYSDVRAHTSQAPSRLEVLAGERDPAVSEAFSEDDYRAVVGILQVFYNIILTDCGTGIMHSAMRGVLDLAHALVLVGSPALDGARSAAATLDWLQAHGYDDLVERTVVVVSAPRPGTSAIDMEALTRHFLARCRALHVVPFDEHLAEGAEIDLERLRPATRRAFVELAAIVADDFPPMSGRHAGHR